MKHDTTVRSSRQGTALITALIMITIATTLLIALSARHLSQRIQVDRYEEYSLAFEGAEAAQHHCVANLETGSSGSIGLDHWTPEFNEFGILVLPDFSNGYSASVSLAALPELEMMGYTYHWFGDGRDSNGDGIVDSLAEFGVYSVHTAARINNQTRHIEGVYSAESVNVWNNAIFADKGQTGSIINGNVSIHGSVHLLGDNLQPGNVAVSAIDMTGTALISNDYAGMPQTLAERIPPLPVRQYRGEEVATLNAKLRVRNGLVGLSGNARIGRDWAVETGAKGPLDGTYVNSGWTGNSVLDDGNRGIPDPDRFFSDNGHEAGYDLGDRVIMPYMNHEWREPDGSRITNPSTGDWYTFEDYFAAVLTGGPDAGHDTSLNGSLTLNAAASQENARYWNATTGEYLVGTAAINAAPATTDDYLLFNPMTKVLHVNGQIRINGSLTFTGKGNETTLYYTGRAALIVTGDITIDTDLLTCNQGDPSDTANSFPANNILGMMSKSDIIVGSTAQRQIMGAFYAHGAVSTEKQSNITGTFVANHFNMGTNVPSIYQVPDLALHLPYGMIGNFPIIVMRRESWREMDV